MDIGTGIDYLFTAVSFPFLSFGAFRFVSFSLHSLAY